MTVEFRYQTVNEMYGDDDLGNNPIFPHNYINYGDWENLDTSGEISYDTRVEASANLYRRLLDNMQVDTTHSLLEIASGRGKGGELIQWEYQPLSYTAVDASFHQALRTKQHLQRFSKDVARVVQSYAESLPFRDNTFDRIISVEAIQHFKDPQAFINEAYRLLRPGGKIAFCSFFQTGNRGNHEFADRFPTVALGIDKMIPISSIRNGLENTGFQNVISEPRGNFLWEPFIKWCHQVQPQQDWSKNWLEAYKDHTIDYYHIYGEKPMLS